MASIAQYISTTPRLSNDFGTTMNATDDDYHEEWSSYDYDPTLNLVIDVPVLTMYAIIFLVGMTGNLLVIFAVVKSRRLHNVTCLFLANLALADLLTVVFLIPLQILAHISDSWNLGDALCRLTAYVGVISPVCSVFTMMIIGLERQIEPSSL
nr:neuropeptide FF receptor 2-like [Lytechinus pictus]